MESSPEQELLGALTSHGPTRGLYTPAEPFRALQRPEATGAPGANPPMSAERMRAALRSPAGAPALLQRRMPGSSAGMVALEGPGKIPGDQGRPAATQRSKPALPGAREKPETARARGSSRGREGHHYRTFFSAMAATGLAAMRDSRRSGEVPCSTSVRPSADARWSASGNGSRAGNKRAI